MNEALIESFLKFDSVLLDSEVKKVLQKLANDEQEEPDQANECAESGNANEENHQNGELNAVEEAKLLKKEAEVPIEELMKRYNGEEKHFHSPNIAKRILNNNTDEKAKDSQTETVKTEVVLFICSSLLCNYQGYLGSTTFIIGTEITITTRTKTSY